MKGYKKALFYDLDRRSPLVDLLEFSLKNNNVLSEEKTLIEIKKVIQNKKKLNSKTFKEYSKLLNVSSSDYYYFTENSYLSKFIEAIYDDNIMNFVELLEEGKKYDDIKYKLVLAYFSVITNEPEKVVDILSFLYGKLDVMNYDELNIFQYIIIFVKYTYRQLTEGYEIIQFFKKRTTHNSKLNAKFYYVSYQICFDLGLHNEANYYLEQAISIATDYYNIKFLSLLIVNKIMILAINNECNFAQDYYEKYRKIFNSDQLKFIEIVLDKPLLCCCIDEIGEIECSELRNKLIFKMFNSCITNVTLDEFYDMVAKMDNSILLEEDVKKVNFYEYIVKKDYPGLEKYYTKHVIPLYLRDNLLLELHWLNKLFLNVMSNNHLYKSVFKCYSKTLFEIEDKKSRLVS